ncbi:MAG: ferredoxin [Verrucomicrobia bacterium]|nr:ferredoxin [Verrucomicrobiota bacterium]
MKDNVRGKYYVDYQCLDCDLCRETSPNNFKRNDERGESYIYKQPETPEEIELCNEAIEGCCVKAIRDDGDRFDWDTIPPYDWDANGTLAEEPKKEGCCCNKKTPPENPAPST